MYTLSPFFEIVKAHDQITDQIEKFNREGSIESFGWNPQNAEEYVSLRNKSSIISGMETALLQNTLLVGGIEETNSIVATEACVNILHWFSPSSVAIFLVHSDLETKQLLSTPSFSPLSAIDAAQILLCVDNATALLSQQSIPDSIRLIFGTPSQLLVLLRGNVMLCKRVRFLCVGNITTLKPQYNALCELIRSIYLKTTWMRTIAFTRAPLEDSFQSGTELIKTVYSMFISRILQVDRCGERTIFVNLPRSTLSISAQLNFFQPSPKLLAFDCNNAPLLSFLTKKEIDKAQLASFLLSS